MNNLTAREQKLIAVAILLALLAIIYLGILLPIVDGFAARDQERTRLQQQLVRNEQILSGLAIWRKDAAQQRQDASSFGLLAPTRAEASDQFRDGLLAHFASAGAEIKSLQDMQATPALIRARVDGQFTLTQLTTSLRELQNRSPYIVIEVMTIAADKALITGHLAPMDVHLEISAPYTGPASR